MAWTKFYDMHSGGGCKLPPYETIFIEADETAAAEVFERRFDRDPYNETCNCCGSDYSIYESEPDADDRADASTLVLSVADFAPTGTSRNMEEEK